MSLLAIDMGTSCCKAVAFSEDGIPLSQKTESYFPESPHASWLEMSPGKFWQALLSVARAIAGEAASDPVEAIAISSHGETFVPVDSSQRALGPAILNADNRAVVEAKLLEEEIGRSRLFEITGLAAHSMYPMAKILWLRTNRPDLFSSTACFVALPSYLLTRLGLPAYVDYSLASRYLGFDIRKKAWSGEILSACGLRAEQLPAPVPAGTVAGELTAEIAAQLGLRPGTPVVVGGHDQPCAALGSGVIDAGRVSASFGTYECLLAASNSPPAAEISLIANLNSSCHVVPSRYVTLAYFPSGIMIEWFLRVVHSAQEFRESSVGDLCAALETLSAEGPSGLCITPHLLGTCNPDFDPRATGVIAGIRPGTGRADLYKGILEGIACEFATMADLLRQATGAYNAIYVSGGGGRSRLGLKLRAALAGRELHLMGCPEAVCLGTAILAGVAVGKYTGFSQAIDHVVRVSEKVEPDAEVARDYQAQAQQYRILYASLAAVRNAQPKLQLRRRS